MQIKYDIVREDVDFEYGKTYHRTNEDEDFVYICDYMRLKEPLWFTQEPQQIFTDFGISIERRRSVELEYLFNGNIEGYYYLSAASDGTDEAAKWLLGAVAAHMNEKSLPFSHINQIMPADYLKTFISFLKENKFERWFSKEIFAELLCWQRFVDNENGQPIRRMTGPEVLDQIISNPHFKAVDASEIDIIIDDVIAANQDQAVKVIEQPKVIQWFVGQVMKAAKGKASAPVVLDKLKIKFNIGQ